MALPHLSRMTLLLSLLLLAPRVGFAQEQTSQPPPEAATAQQEAPRAREDAPTAMQPERTADAPLPGSGARPSTRLMPATETDRPSQPLRVLAEVGASLLTGVGGLVVGYMSTFALISSFSASSPLYALAAPTLIGVGLGVSLGTYWGGQLAGGDASFGGTLLGTLLGGAAALLVGAIPEGNPVLGLVLAPPLMVLGSIIGYENTEHGGTPPPARVQPLLSVSPRGAVVGLAGAF